MCEVQKRSTLAVVICSDAFHHLARAQARVRGIAGLSLVVIPHPVTGISAEQLQARAALALPQILAIAGNHTA